jgi:hypothetical protein
MHELPRVVIENPVDKIARAGFFIQQDTDVFFELFQFSRF